uniref:leucine-rich repeat domain-containing protein n=1 Tax=Maribellus sediminis TaxID=2696285 RepID=UPI00143054DB
MKTSQMFVTVIMLLLTQLSFANDTRAPKTAVDIFLAPPDKIVNGGWNPYLINEHPVNLTSLPIVLKAETISYEQFVSEGGEISLDCPVHDIWYVDSIYTFDTYSIVERFYGAMDTCFNQFSANQYFTVHGFYVYKYASPEEGGTVYGDSIRPFGETAYIEATPNPGWIFQGWYENNQLVSTDTAYFYTVDTTHAFTALFYQDTTINEPILTDLQKDSLALVALYHATDGPNWDHKDNWLAGPLESWWGITVANERVTHIKFGNIDNIIRGNNLNGILPPEMANLTELQTLDLEYNNIQGLFPTFIPGLTKLRVLIIRDASLTGNYPSSLGSLVNIEELKLWNTGLTGPIPETIWSLSSLKRLALAANLTGTISPNIGNLTNLESLYLYGSLDGEIPDEIGNLTHLTELYLGWNNLTGNIPISMGNFSQLITMHLGGNQLNGGIPAEFGQLGNIRNISLENNNLSDPLPAELCYLQSLEYLELGGNNFDSQSCPTIRCLLDNHVVSWYDSLQIQQSGFSLTNGCVDDTEAYNLRTDSIALVALYNAMDGPNWTNNDNWLTGLIDTWNGVTIENNRVNNVNLYNNNLYGTIPAEIGNLTNLKELSLGRNLISGTIPSDIGNLDSLEYLFIHMCQLEGEIPQSISNLSQLKHLSLFRNNLSGEIPEELFNIPTLTDVQLGENEFTGEIPATIYSRTNLRVLQLDDNNLSGTLTSEIGNLLELTGLTLDNNQLIGTLPPEMGQLSNLSYMYLENNDFSGIIPSGLCNLPRLVSINFSNNNFDSQSCPTIQCLKDNGVKFEYVDPDQIQQSGFSLINDCVNDTMVYNLQTDSMALVALYNATDGPNWMANENWLEGPIDSWIGIDTSSVTNRISRIELPFNNLSGELPIEIGYLTGLERLELYGNNLTGRIPAEIGNLTNLIRLDLDSNNLSGLIPSEIGNLTNLEHLVLCLNKLSGEIPSEIGNMSQLKELDFNDNNLTGSIPEELCNISGLEELRLGGNQLSGNIPDLIGNLDSLKYFYLDRNQLEGEIPISLGDMDNIEDIRFADNLFTGLPNLSNLSRLYWLEVYNNRLTFEDLESNTSIHMESAPNGIDGLLKYSPQDSIDTSKTINRTVGDSLILQAQCGGNYNRYVWFKPNGEQDTSRSGILIVPDISFNDSGVYSYEVENDSVPGLVLKSYPITVIVNEDTVSQTTVAPPNKFVDEPILIQNIHDSIYGITYLPYTYLSPEITLNQFIAEGGVVAYNFGVKTITYSDSLVLDSGYNVLSRMFFLEDSLGTMITLTQSITWRYAESACIITIMKPSYAGYANIDSVIVAVGENIQVEAFSYPGWKFEYWSAFDSVISSDASFTLHVTSTTDLFAQFVSDTIPDDSATISIVTPPSAVVEVPCSPININDSTLDLTNLPYSESPTQITIIDFTDEGGTITSNCDIQSIEYYDIVEENIETTIFSRTFIVSDTCGHADTAVQIFTLPTIIEINWVINPLGTGYVIGENNYAYGDTAVLQAIANPGYEFMSWMENGNEISYDSTIYFIADTSHYFTVNFNQDTLIQEPELSDLQKDSLALVAFYYASGGVNWYSKQNWLTSSPIDTWEGVWVDQGRVRAINKCWENFDGEIPDEFYNLTGIWEINICGEGLSGEISSLIGNLTELRYINLSSTNISGSIPPEIEYCKDLESMYIGYNDLESIPLEICNTSIQYIDLSYNNLDTSSCAAFQCLVEKGVQFNGDKYQEQKSGFNYIEGCGIIPSGDPVPAQDSLALVALYNSTNGSNWYRQKYWLSEYPVSIWEGVNVYDGRVRELQMWDNNLNGNLPVEFYDLTGLRYFEFGYDSLSGPILPQFGNLADLYNFSIRYTQMAGELPSEMGNCNNLRYMNIEGNNFTFIQEGICNAPFEYVNLAYNNFDSLSCSAFQCLASNGAYFDGDASQIQNNGFSPVDECGIIPAGVLIENQDSLALVALYNATGGENWNNNYNWLTNAPVSEWAGVRVFNGRVGEINLCWENFNGSIPDEFYTLTGLRKITFCGEGLNGEISPLIGNLTNLVSLTINSTQLSGPIPTEIENLTSLLTFNIGYNYFSTIPSSICNINSLNTVNLSWNYLDASSCAALQCFVDNNVSFEGDVLQQQRNGFSIFEGCGIIPPGEPVALQDSLALVALYNATGGENWQYQEHWLTEWPVSTWQGVYVYDGRVRNLDRCWENFSGSLPEEFYDLTGLRYLNLCGEGLGGQISPLIGNFTELISVYIQNTQIDGSVPAEVGNLTNLESFVLRYNNLSLLSPEICSTPVQRVDFAGNSLDSASCAAVQCLVDKGVTFENDAAQTQRDGSSLFEWCGFIPPGEPVALQDSLALVALYYATGGENWQYQEHWLTEWPVSTWQGVNVYDGRVRYLDRCWENFSGSLPDEFYDLTGLRYLNLCGEGLGGQISPLIGNLTELYNLNISSTSIDGELPPEIGNLGNLESLYLGYNYLTHVPSDVCSTPIRYVDFTANYLDSSSCATIQCLSDLGVTFNGDASQTQRDGNSLFEYCGFIPKGEYVAIQDSLALVALYLATGGESWNNNKFWLSEYPLSMWQGVEIYDGRVRNLYLQWNNLNGEIPPEFYNLTGLRWLYLSGNNISGPITSEVGNLNELEGFNIEDANFEGGLPIEICNTGIRYINLQGNNFNTQSCAAIQCLLDKNVEFWGDPAQVQQSGYSLINDCNDGVSNNFVIAPADRNFDEYIVVESLNDSIYGVTNLPYSIDTSYIILEQFLFEGGDFSLDCGVASISYFDNLETYTQYDPYSGQNYIPVTRTFTISDTCGQKLIATQTFGIPIIVFQVTTYANPLEAGYTSGDGTNWQGDIITVNAYPNPGWFFSEWTVDGNTVSKEQEYSFVLDSNKELIANFVIDSTYEEPCNLTIYWNSPNPLPYQEGSYDLGLQSHDEDLYWHVILGEDTLAQGYTGPGGNTLGVVFFTVPQNPYPYPLTGEIYASGCDTNTLIPITQAENSSLSQIQDSLALVALYNATDGPNWTNNTNWLTGPIESWFGVYTENGRVTSIQLSSNNLQGSLPPEIGQLTNLREMYLSSNSISGFIPPELGLLTNLNYLNLGNTQISGSIPLELGQLVNLYVLSLDNCNLNGQIPIEFGQLENLQTLNLNGNQLTGQIPDEIGLLNNLERLILGSNQLSGTLPVALGQLSNLYELYLSDNQLSGFLPQEFEMLINLGILSLANNQFSGAIPVGLCNIPNLVTVNFIGNNFDVESCPAIQCLSENGVYFEWDYNQIQQDGYYLTTGCISNPVNVEDSLALVAIYYSTNGDNWINNDNWLEGPVSSWYGVTIDNNRVSELYLCTNNLEGYLPPEIGQLDAIRTLIICENNLSSTIPNELGMMRSLEFVQLYSNHFVGEVPSEINNLKNLYWFNVNNNSLTSMPVLDSLFNLNHLLLAWNNFTFEDIESNIGVANEYCRYSPQRMIGQYTDTTFTLCSEVILTMPVGGNYNKYQWFKDGIPVSDTLITDSLLIPNLSMQDSGAYTCQVTNTLANELTLYSYPIIVNPVHEPVYIVEPVPIVSYVTKDSCNVSPEIHQPEIINNCDYRVINNLEVIYSVGEYVIEWSVVDENDIIVASAIQNLSVIDTFIPVILTDSAIVAFTEPGMCSAFINNIPLPELWDNCGISTAYYTDGPEIPVGENWINLHVEDIHGNSADYPVQVTVIDNEAPFIDIYAAVIEAQTEPGQCYALSSSLELPPVFDNCSEAYAWYPDSIQLPVG